MLAETDILILGSGIGGLTLALKAARYGEVLVVTKKAAEDSSTNWAQGGIAAVFEPGDSFRSHVDDTLRCGVGLSDPAVVRAVVAEAPERVEELARTGVAFSRKGGSFDLGREGGHTHRRIVHASDLTGHAVEHALLERVRAHPRIRLLENQLAVDLILDSRLDGRHPAAPRDACWGAYVMDRHSQRIRRVSARVTVLATGGCGKVYLYTSNPDVATGDGIAMAYRAGVPVESLEFVQFHPTVLFHPAARTFLISEAVRGEGAILRTLDGQRFMPRYHKLAELAPRDVVARAIDREMKRRGEAHVWLDITHVRADRVRRRFPGIDAQLRALGIDMTSDPIPVVPAAHYMCGGVQAKLSGRTAVAGLLAIGEVACTGLHGANRLASNSLLEALVGAHHAADEIEARLASTPRARPAAAWQTRGTRPPQETVVCDHNWETVRRVMWDLVGIVRTDERLAFAARRLALLREEIERDYDRLRLSPDLIELRNIALVGSLVVACAQRRRESRGLHYNVDHPRRSSAFGQRVMRLRRPAGAGRRLCRALPATYSPSSMSGETAFWDAVDALRAERRRYAREAYGFVVAGLTATVQGLPESRRSSQAARHLDGGELLVGLVRIAREEFGAMAPVVFREWGVCASEDVGAIVFELVGCGQLSARPEDTLDDFRRGFDLLGELGAGLPNGGSRPTHPA